MSALTLTEPEVLTDHTDMICSTSIERIVAGRMAYTPKHARTALQVRLCSLPRGDLRQ